MFSLYSVQYLAKQDNGLLFVNYDLGIMLIRISVVYAGYNRVRLLEEGRDEVVSFSVYDGLRKRFGNVNVGAFSSDPIPCLPNECAGFKKPVFGVSLGGGCIIVEVLLRADREDRYVAFPASLSQEPVWWGYFHENGNWWLIINNGVRIVEIVEFIGTFAFLRNSRKMAYCKTLRELMFLPR